MLEILLIIHLSKKIGAIAESKGHSKGGYIAMFVISWILGEFLGAIFGVLLTGSEGLGLYLFALIGAGIAVGVSFLIVNSLSDRSVVDKPDSYFTQQSK